MAFEQEVVPESKKPMAFKTSQLFVQESLRNLERICLCLDFSFKVVIAVAIHVELLVCRHVLILRD